MSDNFTKAKGQWCVDKVCPNCAATVTAKLGFKGSIITWHTNIDHWCSECDKIYAIHDGYIKYKLEEA